MFPKTTLSLRRQAKFHTVGTSLSACGKYGLYDTKMPGRAVLRAGHQRLHLGLSVRSSR